MISTGNIIYNYLSQDEKLQLNKKFILNVDNKFNKEHSYMASNFQCYIYPENDDEASSKLESEEPIIKIKPVLMIMDN